MKEHWNLTNNFGIYHMSCLNAINAISVGIGIPREYNDSTYRLHKNNPNKATKIQFESIPRDMSGLISIKIESQQIARPSKPSTLLPYARTYLCSSLDGCL